MRIALIASARYALSQPFPGGLEVHTWQLATGLTARGHEVCVFAGPGSDPSLHVHEMPAMPALSSLARQDVSMPAEYFMAEHFAYLTLMQDLASDDSYDVVHNNSLHYLPIAMAEILPAPTLTTLHTPPTPWMETAMASRPRQRVHYAAVSRITARQWQPMVPEATIIRNGVDLGHWVPGPGGGTPVWSGRVVPEKGLEHAIAAARLAGTGLRIAGPRPDPGYFTTGIEPLLGAGIDYVGHLDHKELATLVGSASVAVVSPRWDEPYGLVVAEAMACGTPVAAFARGALPELVTPEAGSLAPPDDIEGLARAIRAAQRRDRNEVRRHAVAECSVDAMIDGYEAAYQRLR